MRDREGRGERKRGKGMREREGRGERKRGKG